MQALMLLQKKLKKKIEEKTKRRFVHIQEFEKSLIFSHPPGEKLKKKNLRTEGRTHGRTESEFLTGPFDVEYPSHHHFGNSESCFHGV